MSDTLSLIAQTLGIGPMNFGPASNAATALGANAAPVQAPPAIALPPTGAAYDQNKGYTDYFNTPLTPAQEAAFQAWGKQQAAIRPDHKNPAMDTYDYDMRGAWLNNAQAAANGHLPDTWKKPNEPTFSTMSKYSNPKTPGGVWGQEPGGGWTFTPSEFNLQMNSPEDLQKNWSQEQPGAKLILPSAQPTPQPAAPSSPVVNVPISLMPIYQAAAQRTGIPIDVLIAQGKQESGFNPAAIGSAGEIGIMQVKPSTASDPGYGLSGINPKTLTDPATNINFAADYLKARAGKGADFSSPAAVDAALAAYNSGGDRNYVANVRRYMRTAKAPSSDDSIS
jgi:hypothetical protein